MTDMTAERIEQIRERLALGFGATPEDTEWLLAENAALAAANERAERAEAVIAALKETGQ